MHAIDTISNNYVSDTITEKTKTDIPAISTVCNVTSKSPNKGKKRGSDQLAEAEADVDITANSSHAISTTCGSGIGVDNSGLEVIHLTIRFSTNSGTSNANPLASIQPTSMGFRTVQ